MAGRIKRMICSVHFGYEDWLLLCFLLGVCAGTAAALFFGEISLQGAVFGLEEGAKGPSLEGFFSLLQFSMSLGASVSLLTMQKGLLGPLYFGGLILPQSLFYGFVWYILAGWAAPGGKKLHLAGAIFLIGIMAVGVYLEIH